MLILNDSCHEIRGKQNSTGKVQINKYKGFPDGSDGKESACSEETWIQSLGQENSLEKGMATHASILAWRSPQTEEPGGGPWGHKESDTTD